MPSRIGLGITRGPHYIGVGWFGDGSDGNVTISSNTSLPVTLDSGYIIKNYNNLTINSGRTLTAQNRCNGMILLVKGDLILNGTISMSYKCPLLNTAEAEYAAERHVALCNVIGGNGGKGGQASSTAVAKTYDTAGGGSAGNGGSGSIVGGGWGGGSGAFYGGWYYGPSVNGAVGDRAPIGTTFPITTNRYGSGGSASRTSGTYGGSGPGGSGGAYGYTYDHDSVGISAGVSSEGNQGNFSGGSIIIFVGGNITIGSNGRIESLGGNGGDGAYVVTPWEPDDDEHDIMGCSGGGGGSGGGPVGIVYGESISSGAASHVFTTGGNGGSGLSIHNPFTTYWRYTSTAGSKGSDGQILISKIIDLF